MLDYRRNVWVVEIVCNSERNNFLIFAVFGCLKVSRGIFLALKMLASISDLGFFVLAMFFPVL